MMFDDDEGGITRIIREKNKNLRFKKYISMIGIVLIFCNKEDKKYITSTFKR